MVTNTDRQLKSSQPGLWSHSLCVLGQRLVTFLREHSVTIWSSQSLVKYSIMTSRSSDLLDNDTPILSWILTIQLHIQHVVELVSGDTHGGDIFLTLHVIPDQEE